MAKRITCPTCQGAGWIIYQGTKSDCIQCGGKGWIVID